MEVHIQLVCKTCGVGLHLDNRRHWWFGLFKDRDSYSDYRELTLGLLHLAIWWTRRVWAPKAWAKDRGSW
jgi:hypothetical protein